MKTQNEILSDFYKIIKSTPINDLSGGVYKKTRPTNSKLEDCIISLMSGSNAKFLQDAALYVKIFYNDIKANNSFYENELKGQELETLLNNLSETLLHTNGYSFLIQTRESYTKKVLEDDINQHFAILKINFLLTQN